MIRERQSQEQQSSRFDPDQIANRQDQSRGLDKRQEWQTQSIHQSKIISNELKVDTLTAIDKLDKIGIDGVSKELAERGLPPKVVSSIVQGLDQDSTGLKSIIAKSIEGQAGINEVDEVISYVSPLLSDGKIEFSPFLARGLNYYTGPIFEIYLEGSVGAIGSGGRYDKLLSMFSGKDTPACGGSLGIDRILSTLEVNIDEKLIDLKADIFDACTEPCLNHGDLWEPNVLVREENGNWEIAAIVDADDAFFLQIENLNSCFGIIILIS